MLKIRSIELHIYPNQPFSNLSDIFDTGFDIEKRGSDDSRGSDCKHLRLMLHHIAVAYGSDRREREYCGASETIAANFVE